MAGSTYFVALPLPVYGAQEMILREFASTASM